MRLLKKFLFLKKFLPSNRDLLIIVLILAFAFGTQYLGQYFSYQTFTSLNPQSSSQSVDLKPMEFPTSPPLLVPSPPSLTTPNVVPSIRPTPSPSSAPSTTPSPAPSPAPTEPPHDSAISVTPSPSPTSNPLSVLKLSLYRSNPVQTQQILQNIDWGQIVPGQTSNSQTIYFRNEGTMPLTMSFSPIDWVFKDASGNSLPESYSQYFTLTWNYDNTPINVNEVRPLIFSLAVSSNLTDVASFSFNLRVTITSTN